MPFVSINCGIIEQETESDLSCNNNTNQSFRKVNCRHLDHSISGTGMLSEHIVLCLSRPCH